MCTLQALDYLLEAADTAAHVDAAMRRADRRDLQAGVINKPILLESVNQTWRMSVWGASGDFSFFTCGWLDPALFTDQSSNEASRKYLKNSSAPGAWLVNRGRGGPEQFLHDRACATTVQRALQPDIEVRRFSIIDIGTVLEVHR